MEWNEFVKKMGWDPGKVQEGFTHTIYELEKDKGRPVYYGEVLLYMNEKTGDEKLDNYILDRLSRLRNEAADSGSLGTVSVDELLVAYRNIAGVAKNRKVFKSEFDEEIDDEMTTLDKLGYHAKQVISANEPFIYSKEEERGTAFYKKEKSEKTVARQFARWLKQPKQKRTSYLELIEK